MLFFLNIEQCPPLSDLCQHLNAPVVHSTILSRVGARVGTSGLDLADAWERPIPTGRSSPGIASMVRPIWKQMSDEDIVNRTRLQHSRLVTLIAVH
jgi:hypothetical protein